ncbi:glycosyltransferase family protein [Desulfogranum japonicum]|uniref:hypothetical protein n=1 Tax=Desulfogranum japonicum TaxID=231447 RepID=UPI0004179ECB|nr:hypothetical protein [Desulfogranum japonicum]
MLGAGKRNSRDGEKWLKKATAAAFYRVFSRLSRFSFPRDIGDFHVLQKRVVMSSKGFMKKIVLMKSLFAWAGFHQLEFLYDRDARIRENLRLLS